MMAQSESPGIRLHLQGGWLLGHRLRPQLLPRREAIEEMGASGIPAAFTPTAFAPRARHGSHQPTQPQLKHKQTPHLPELTEGQQHVPVTGKGSAKPLGNCRVPSPLCATSFLLVGCSPRW